ncbi:MAG: penicillin-binding protein 2 [Myxococcales bacterium]|nr:MAG: penicillin-binding protein 2 [Myxococcales bacterium]
MQLESKLSLVKEYRHRYVWLVVVVALAFGLLAFRLAYLQLSKGVKYSELSEQNFVQERVIMPLRGRIFDKSGELLADNRPAYNVYITPAFVSDLERTLVRLEGYLNLSSEESLRLRHAARGARGLARFQELLVKRDISREHLALLESQKLDLPGVAVRPEPRRYYPQDLLVSHLIGYVGRITEEEHRQRPDYVPYDVIGKKGIESSFEAELHGRYGLERVVVDAQGRAKSEEEAQVLLQGETRVLPAPGHDLILSIDLDLQKVADSYFKNKAGGVFAMDVKTGFVLVWLSEPGFDPNKFAAGISAEDWAQYQASILNPLVDKVAQSAYYPGSTYKAIAATAGLQEGIIGEQTGASCSGSRSLGGHVFHCWRRTGHGSVTLIRGIKESCDIFFYMVGEKVGPERLFKWAGLLGLGEKPGTGLNNETPGVLPSMEWHLKTYGYPWYPGDTLSHVIGQGDLKVSPMQLAVAYAAIANNGTVLVPQVVREIRDLDGRVVEVFDPKVKRRLDLKPETVRLVREGLTAVVNEPGGTAYLSRLIKPRFAGKTGTAQVASLPADKKTHDAYRLKDHGWFVGFAPAEEPEIVVVAMGEHSEHGSWLAPIIRELIAAWWEKKTGQPAQKPPAPWFPRAIEAPAEDE